jgi:HD-GYP domain-containing protein (c-di-GMP phosphodiesterase class II)
MQRITPGQILAEAITSPDEKITIGPGTVLNDSWIKRLREWGIKKVSVGSGKKEASSVDELQALLSSVLQVIKEPGPKQVQVKTPNQKAQEDFFKICTMVETELCRIFLSTRCTNKKLPIKILKKLAGILYDTLAVPGLFSFIHIPARAERYLYRHAIDVALFCGLMGKWAGLPIDNVKVLVYAGLIHDIGKTRVFYEILAKPSSLNASERLLAEQHVEYSRTLLEDAGLESERILAAVYQHHEKIDGSGYPSGLSGSEVHPFAKVLAVADVYDALTSDRYYRARVSPLEAAEIMLYDMTGHFDSEVLTRFCEQLQQNLIGVKVSMSNSMTGEIVGFHPLPSMRPLVMLEDGKSVDLAVDELKIIDFRFA